MKRIGVVTVVCVLVAAAIGLIAGGSAYAYQTVQFAADPPAFQSTDMTLGEPITGSTDVLEVPEMVLIPAGLFAMGDHHNYVDPAHPSDEVPIHTVSISSLYV